MLKTAVGVVGVGKVDGVGVAHEEIGALHDCAKYRRSREESLFSNIATKKTSAKFKRFRDNRVTSSLLKRAVCGGPK